MSRDYEQMGGEAILASPQLVEKKKSSLVSKMKVWKSHPGSALIALLVWLAALLTLAIMVFLVGFIEIKGVRYLTPDLFAFTYNSENVSLMPALINTLIITVLSLLIAIPVGVFAAIYLVE